MTESFVPVTVPTGPVTKELLQQFSSNDQFLFENMPKMLYRADVTRTKGLKILAGKSLFTLNNTQPYTNVAVSFGGYFSVGSSPVVVATPYGGKYANKFVNIRAIDVTTADVDHRGFNATVYGVNTKVVESNGYVHWIAIGI